MDFIIQTLAALITFRMVEISNTFLGLRPQTPAREPHGPQTL